jgi:hypothetical protein
VVLPGANVKGRRAPKAAGPKAGSAGAVAPTPHHPQRQHSGGAEVIRIDCDSGDERQSKGAQQQRPPPGRQRPPSIQPPEPPATAAAVAEDSPASPSPGGARLRPSHPNSPLYTLLPGYASRPDPSPLKGRGGRGGGRGGLAALLPGGGGGAGAVEAEDGGDDGAGGSAAAPPTASNAPAPTAGALAAAALAEGIDRGDTYAFADGSGGGFFPDLAAAGGGPGGSTTVPGAGSGAMGFAAPCRNRQGRTLLQQHLMAMSDETHQAAAAQRAVSQQHQQQQGAPPQGAPPQGATPQGATQVPTRAIPRRPPPAAATAVFNELAAELREARTQRARQEAAPPPRQLPAAAEPAQAAAGGSSQRPDQGSQPASSAANPADAPAPLDLRLHRGEVTPQEARALDSLPLPSLLERLLRIFEALATWQGFLIRQHMAATWANSRAHVQGFAPLVRR